VKRTRFALGALLVLVVGVALRSWPLLHSPLPFNPDGIVYAGQVSVALENGVFPLGRMAVDDLQFTAFLTILSQITGHQPLYIAQPAIAVVGTVPVLIAVAAGRWFGTQFGRSWARATGLVAGALLAVEGIYLHRSMPVDEQTLGLLFVPLAVYAVANVRTDRRWLVVLVLLGLVLPPTHNLDSAILGVVLVAATALYIAQGADLRTIGAALGGTLLYWLYMAGYMYVVAATTAAEVIQSARITDIPGLFLAWILLAAITCAWFVTSRERTQRLVLLAGFSGLLVLVVVNAVVPVFPGLPSTKPLILAGAICLVVPMLAAVYGAPQATPTQLGIPFSALVAAVFGFIGLTLTAALTADYLNTLYRAQTFIHLPVLAFSALGLAVLASQRAWSVNSTPTTILAVILVLAAAASIPVAYSGLDALPYKGVTTEGEFDASSFAVEYVPETWASDDHLTRITRYYGPNQSNSVLPVYSWMQNGPPPTCPVLSQGSWTTTGAQFYPKSPVSVSSANYDSFVERRHVVYRAGASDTITLSIPKAVGVNGC
jgi:hypothetical protein